MTYQQTCDYIFKLTSFEQQGQAGLHPGLANVEALVEADGHPEQQFKSIHIAGTNGKGSVAHTLAAILQECGYKVGLYTSPHLVDFRERIRINGKPVSEDFVVKYVEKHRADIDKCNATFFEIATAMAFSYFKDEHVDIAVVEVGLGGRLDATNILHPIFSIITNISLDHTQILGSTVEQIAIEKAGIIKSETPVIIGEATDATRPVFEAVADELNAPIIFAEDDPEVIEATLTNNGFNYKTKHDGDLTGRLGGSYQPKNMNTVLTAVRMLEKLGMMYTYPDDERSEARGQEVARGLLNVCETTGLRGRWETVGYSPRIICDTGHNVAGWTFVTEQLKQLRYHRLHFVFGVVEDKDYTTLYNMLPKDATYYYTKAQNKRAVSEHVLKAIGDLNQLHGEAYPSVSDAFNAAKAVAESDDLVFVGGSSYVVADFLKNCI
ncbi:MAG: bifunctional folylpolyglutamate synthase/dihydrofolate synthase [Prevotella sp.]|nr:bifunctional folylpolyglutamate synthase/dihydrofolate synthase [Prevotella sp.]